jgi:arylsulfatase A-like enzyme
MRGTKGTSWRGGSRAMSFWHWPSQFVPRDINQTTAHIDVLPTLCDLAGVSLPEELRSMLDGRSLVGLLRESDSTWPDRMLVTHVARWDSNKADEHKYTMAVVRWKNYRLVRNEACGNPNCKRKQCQAVLGKVKSHAYTSDVAFHFAPTPPKGHWALFDVSTDESESNDIAAKHPDIVSAMTKAYEQWWQAVRPFIK